MLKNTPNTYKVERRTSDPNGWYEVMLSPFETFEECLEYIKKYSQYYSPEQQNYKITNIITVI